MLEKTRGIVLKYICYGETSIITKIYTEELGLKSYIVSNVRSKKAKYPIGLFQPLTLLDMIVYNNANKDLNRVSELKIHKPFSSIPFEISKTYIAFFITELLVKTLSKEEAPDKQLFTFLKKTIISLDNDSQHMNEIPIKLLIDFSGFMGFMIQDVKDIKQGIVYPDANNNNALNPKEEEEANTLIKDPDKWNKTMLTLPGIHKKLFHQLLEFFRYHFDTLQEMKSVKILEELN